MLVYISLILRRIANTWTLMGQSLGLIKSYRTLMWFPVISLVFCFFTSVIVLGGGVLVLNLPIQTTEFAPTTLRVNPDGMSELTRTTLERFLGDGNSETETPLTAEGRKVAERSWLLVFLLYVANYIVISYFSVAFAAVVLDRFGGGSATLDYGLQLAWARKFSILQWALVSASIGVLFKMIRERGGIEGWIGRALGYVWRLAAYFVIPLLATENLTPGDALFRSAALLKEKWGEVIIAGFSFPLLYLVLASPGIGVFFLAGLLGQSFGFAAILVTGYWLALAIIMSAAAETFAVALYRYARHDVVSRGFSRIELHDALEGLKPLPIGQAL